MTASDTASRLRRSLAELIAPSPWAQAVAAVPREMFLGRAVYRMPGYGDRWEVVRRADMAEAEWLALVYQDETWVTQVGGIAADEAAETVVSGAPTSSSTLPSLVVRMLEAAEISPGDRVLEIGTGTGYSTALMCHRLGDRLVTSIEYDPVVAARARSALAQAGYAPTLVVGDGLSCYQQDGEYDRLIATCAVRVIPMPWVWQVRDGGTITTPLWGWMGATVFAHLTLDEEGTAGGRFLDDRLEFMAARPHLPPPLTSTMLPRGEPRESGIDPNLLDDPTGLFVAQLSAPSAQRFGVGDQTILIDVATGSQASTAKAAAGGWVVRQHGPLKLWDAVEEAVEVWQKAGAPDRSAFGLTVKQNGEQRVWLGTPDGPSWALPA